MVSECRDVMVVEGDVADLIGNIVTFGMITAGILVGAVALGVIDADDIPYI